MAPLGDEGQVCAIVQRQLVCTQEVPEVPGPLVENGASPLATIEMNGNSVAINGTALEVT